MRPREVGGELKELTFLRMEGRLGLKLIGIRGVVLHTCRTRLTGTGGLGCCSRLMLTLPIAPRLSSKRYDFCIFFYFYLMEIMEIFLFLICVFI